MRYSQPGFIRCALFRVGSYLLGLLLIAFGVALSVSSELGVSPLNSIPYVLSQITGYRLSVCVTAVCGCFLLLQILLLRRRFHLIQLTQLIFSMVFGLFVDLARGFVSSFSLPSYAGQLALLAASIILIALGITLYVEVKLVPMPLEGFPLVLSQQLDQPFPRVKNWVDCAMVAVAAVLSFCFLHRLVGIREGTVLTAIFTGRLMAPMKAAIAPHMQIVCGTRDDC